jgi:hypothetical protein
MRGSVKVRLQHVGCSMAYTVWWALRPALPCGLACADGYFMGVPLEQIPSTPIPLHTLIELQPMPDGG